MSLKGKTIVFTGTLKTKRADATAQAKAAGANVTGSVSKNTDILVAGPGAGAKGDKAASLGVDVWSEADFLAALGGGGGGTKAGGKKAAASKKRAAPAASKKSAAKKAKSSKWLEGATFCLTGTLSMSRAEITAKIKAAGGAVAGSVTAACTHVVSTDGEVAKATAKVKQAQKRGVPLVSEAFVDACEEAGELLADTAPFAFGDGTAPAKEPAKPLKTAQASAAPAPAAAIQKAAGGATRNELGVRTDREFSGGSGYSVHEEWAIKLNQTNIASGQNNNKFYILQLLQGPKDFAVWTRWGRVGESGQNQCKKFDSEGVGVKEFRAKFRSKTKNDWDTVAAKSFVKHDGKYQLVETEDPDDSGDDDGDGSSLLGRLSKSQIEKGQEVLAELEQALQEGGGSYEVGKLSGSYYSLIPTATGRKAPPPIATFDMLHEKEELLKFYLRMGFEDLEPDDESLTPISGVMELACPATLMAAAKALANAHEIGNCVAKGAGLAAKQAGSPTKPMSAELYAAIMLYTGNAIYAALNKALRGENRKLIKKYFSYLRLFMEAFEHLGGKATRLWRGISVDLFDSYEVGSTITWWSVSSTTSDQQVARNFMNGCGGKCTLFTIDCKSACDIQAMSLYSNEKESLLAPGTELAIRSKVRKGNITEIHLEEVGRRLD